MGRRNDVPGRVVTITVGYTSEKRVNLSLAQDERWAGVYPACPPGRPGVLLLRRLTTEQYRSEMIARRYDRWSLDIALVGIPAGNSNVSIFTVPKYLIPFIYFEEIVKTLADV